MKEVNLIKLKSERVMVGDYSDRIEFCNVNLDPTTSISRSDEFVHPAYDIENLPISKIVDYGVTHYMAVERKVWEYLYLIENPVTAKSQEQLICSLKGRVNVLSYASKENHKNYNDLKTKVNEANWLTRIKWVFTGVTF